MERQKKVKNYTDYICMEKSRNQINYFLFSNNARYLNQWGCVIYLDYAIFELIKKFQFTVLNIEVIVLHYIATSLGNAVRLPKMKISLAQFYWKYTTNSLVKNEWLPVVNIRSYFSIRQKSLYLDILNFFKGNFNTYLSDLTKFSNPFFFSFLKFLLWYLISFNSVCKLRGVLIATSRS